MSRPWSSKYWVQDGSEIVAEGAGWTNPGNALGPPDGVAAQSEADEESPTPQLHVQAAITGLIPRLGEYLGIRLSLTWAAAADLSGSWAVTPGADGGFGTQEITPFTGAGLTTYATMLVGGASSQLGLTAAAIRAGGLGAVIVAQDATLPTTVRVDALGYEVWYRVPAPWPRTDRVHRRTVRV